jgi:mRNA interferase HigB
MELTGKYQLQKDAARHSDSPRAVEVWIKTVEQAEWNNITEVKQTYPSADYTSRTGRTIFNIKGNDYRLITIINYSLKIIAYESFLTHAEYDKYKF